LSPLFPYLSHHLGDTFNLSPTSFRVQYLLAVCTSPRQETSHAADVISKALRYPLCTPPVLDLLCSKLDDLSRLYPTLIRPHICELPRRLFRSLTPRSDARDWQALDEPLPFLQHMLYKGTTQFPALNPNSHHGYALTRAVHARHMPLIQLLLDMGASPACKGGIAIKVAIKQKNLKVVRMLIEREERRRVFSSATTLARESSGRQKKQGQEERRLEDDVEVPAQSMLELAVKCNARDIIDYLAWEKGVVPDMQTLKRLRL
jgi:hypothetical protein